MTQRQQLLKDHYGVIGSLGYMMVKSGYENDAKMSSV